MPIIVKELNGLNYLHGQQIEGESHFLKISQTSKTLYIQSYFIKPAVSLFDAACNSKFDKIEASKPV